MLCGAGRRAPDPRGRKRRPPSGSPLWQPARPPRGRARGAPRWQWWVCGLCTVAEGRSRHALSLSLSLHPPLGRRFFFLLAPPVLLHNRCLTNKTLFSLRGAVCCVSLSLSLAGLLLLLHRHLPGCSRISSCSTCSQQMLATTKADIGQGCLQNLKKDALAPVRAHCSESWFTIF